jgi:hypothetical protein
MARVHYFFPLFLQTKGYGRRTYFQMTRQGFLRWILQAHLPDKHP